MLGGLLRDPRLGAQRPRLGAQGSDALARRARDLVARAAPGRLDGLERPEADRLQLLRQPSALQAQRAAELLAEEAEQKRADAERAAAELAEAEAALRSRR